MYLYILFFTCLLITLFSLRKFKDIFAPACIICEMFTISSFFAIVSAKFVNTDISIKTCIYLPAQLIVSIFIASLIKNHKKRPELEKQADVISISRWKYAVLLTAVALLTAVYCAFYMREILISEGASFTQKMASMRQRSITEGLGIPRAVIYILKITTSFAYFSSYIFIHNMLVKKTNRRKCKHNSIYLWSVVFLVAASLITGARAELIYFIVYVVIVFTLVRSKLTYKKFTFKSLLKPAIALAAALALFYLSSFIIGRTSDSFMRLISTYFGSPIIALDRFLAEPKTFDLWGKEAFYSVMHFFDRLGLIKGDVGSIHAEYVYINGEIYTNVYTAFRAYIIDFGVAGSFVLQALMILIYEHFYGKCKFSKNQLGHVNVKFIVYGLISHAIFLHFYGNYFYGQIISSHIAIVIVLIFAYAAILSGKKQKKIGKTEWQVSRA